MDGDHGSPTLIEVAALTKRYGEQFALTDVTFDVRAGEVLGIIGPNGAGKTTLLESIAGLLSADSGDVLWQGRPLPLARRRNKIFYLPDGLRPYQDQYVARVLSFFAGVYRRPRAQLGDTVEQLGLGSVLQKRVHALSKGYARRLVLALGLLTPQPLLLMDEPFDGFDLRQTREVMHLLHALGQRGARSFLPFTSSQTPTACATGSCCWPRVACWRTERSTICASAPLVPLQAWRTFFLRSPETIVALHAPLWPLLVKELHEISWAGHYGSYAAVVSVGGLQLLPGGFALRREQHRGTAVAGTRSQPVAVRWRPGASLRYWRSSLWSSSRR